MRGVDGPTLLARMPALPRELATELGARIEAGLAAIAARWPEAPRIGDAFASYLGERITQQRELATGLPRLRVDDLFLAWWAGTGDPRGIAAFETAYAADQRRLLERFHRLPADELKQQLRIKLFVGTPAHPPRVRDYSGFGFLQNWLRVTAARSFVDAARADQSRRYEDELDEGELLGLAPAGADPRDAQQRAQISAAVKRAFAAAVAALAPRERTFLRHASVDRLTLDQIASTYQIHRATVARTLASARERLLVMTRSGVASELGIPQDDLASAIQQLDSRLELSLSRVLR